MKYSDKDKVAQLEGLPNIGKAMAEDLRLVGVKTPDGLCGKDPLGVYTISFVNELVLFTTSVCLMFLWQW